MKRNNAIILGSAVVALVLMTAGASAYITREAATPEKTVTQNHVVTHERISWKEPAPAPAPAQAQPQANCDDGNIVGNVLGGVGGGIAGSQLGKGKGKTAATIGGTLGGAYVGGKFIPTQNVTCR
jgi:uncharacterized protein YcfJ